MDAPLHVTIRESLRQFARGEASLGEFDAVFGPILWSVESSNDPAAIGLAYEIAGLIAEYGRGHWTADDLIDHLTELVLRDTTPIRSGA